MTTPRASLATLPVKGQASRLEVVPPPARTVHDRLTPPYGFYEGAEPPQAASRRGRPPNRPVGQPGGDGSHEPQMVLAPPPRTGTVSTNLRMPPDVQRALKLISFETATSINELILQAIGQFLERRKP